ncbi:Uncharacterised protein [uncultured archaeon]|nr:Uncharacterised protein [uncultured archaeon]
MGIQYSCRNKNRRNKLLSTKIEGELELNGIDYLEVLDKNAPQGSPRQRTLLVRCFKPVTYLSGNNVKIRGGVRDDPRINPVRVEWAYPADPTDWHNPPDNEHITAEEIDLFEKLPDPGNVLVVRTSSYGDYSTYILSLTADGDTLTGFDPQLSSVEFSFKVECPSGFDCRQQEECSVERLPEPPIDYLARDFASFRRLMLDRLAIIMPDWKERNIADVGITLVELLAYAADHLSYYQDAVASEAYLGTARKRISVRRHARLLDYPMHDGCNARAWVCIEINDDEVFLAKEDEITKSRTRFLTRFEDAPFVDRNRLREVLSLYHPEVFEPMHSTTLYRAHNTISFYTWSDDLCCLPGGATKATLEDNIANRLRLCKGDVLILEERLGPATGLQSDADISHRHAVRLTSVTPEAEVLGNGRRVPGSLKIDPLTKTPIVEIEWSGLDALPFPFCISTVINDVPHEDVSVVHGNVVLADHGMTDDEELEEEELKFEILQEGRYRPRLTRSGITHSVPYNDETVRIKPEPASNALLQKVLDALPAVKLHENSEVWTAKRDLLNSDRFDQSFVVEMDEEGFAHLRFGDDIMGKRPVSSMKATYRTGNGTRGNVGSNAIHHIMPADAALSSDSVGRIWNPLPSQGGTDPESIEQVRLYAPWAFRTQKRAVTENDYAEVAQRHPDVQRAVGTLLWTGSWYTMFVTVDRKGGRPVNDEFRAELFDFLESFRLAGYDLEIESPIFVSLYIKMTVCVKTGYFRPDVESALLRTFSNIDMSGGKRGFFHPDNFTFGKPVYLSRVVSEAMKVPGVLWVDVTDFRRWGQPQGNELIDGEISFGRLEIGRLDNDPNGPENGKIEFEMKGGS